MIPPEFFPLTIIVLVGVCACLVIVAVEQRRLINHFIAMRRRVEEEIKELEGR